MEENSLTPEFLESKGFAKESTDGSFIEYAYRRFYLTIKIAFLSMEGNESIIFEIITPEINFSWRKPKLYRYEFWNILRNLEVEVPLSFFNN